MLASLGIEGRKLNGSLALLLAVVAPSMIGLLCLVGTIAGARAPTWSEILQIATTLWIVFLLPLTVTAFTALLAQIEYKNNVWDHVLSLPIPRWRVFLAKTIIALGSVAGMSALAIILALFGAWLGGLITSRPVTGELPSNLAAAKIALALAGSTMMVALQLWVALRFANFVVPLAFGIGGTLVAIAVGMTGVEGAEAWPWVIGSKILMSPWLEAQPYFLIGSLGGVLVIALMIVDLCHREMR